MGSKDLDKRGVGCLPGRGNHNVQRAKVVGGLCGDRVTGERGEDCMGREEGSVVETSQEA